MLYLRASWKIDIVEWVLSLNKAFITIIIIIIISSSSSSSSSSCSSSSSKNGIELRQDSTIELSNRKRPCLL